MNWFALLSTASFLFISKNKYKNAGNPYTVFNTLWFFVMLLITIGCSGVYAPSTEALTCVLIGILFFNLSMFSPLGHISGIGRVTSGKDEKKFIDTKRLKWLSTIAVILCLYSAIYSITQLLNGVSFSVIRNNYYQISENNTEIMYYMRNWVIIPIANASTVLIIVDAFNRRKIETQLVINLVLCVLLQAITNGGRYVLVNCIFMFVCMYLIKKDSFGGIPKRIKRIAVFLGIIVFWGILTLTNERTTFSTDLSFFDRIYRTLYVYFCGSVTYLGKVIEKNPEVMGTTHGINFFGGVLAVISSVLSRLHIISYPDKLNYIGRYACQLLQIGNGTYYNAMPTIFGYFYIDGKLVLTALESFLFGCACKRQYIKTVNSDILSITWYVLLFVQICVSSTRWFFFSGDYILSFLVLFLFMKKRKELGSDE